MIKKKVYGVGINDADYPVVKGGGVHERHCCIGGHGFYLVAAGWCACIMRPFRASVNN